MSAVLTDDRPTIAELIADQKLQIYQSLWGMQLRSPHAPERSDEQYINPVLNRSDCFQGRVASREQVQVQIGFPQHQPWVAVFKAWWKAGMAQWRQRAGPDDTLVFLCELGPPPYAITDAQQNELSDRWQESQTIRKWVREIWAELDASV